MDNKILRGQIYYVNEEEVSGSEQEGDRPAVVVSNDTGNKYAPIVIVVYLTAQKKKPMPTHVRINSAKRPSIALCEQIDTVDKGRIGKHIGQVSDDEMKAMERALLVSLGIELTHKTNMLVERYAQ